jgi:ElaB/YqjD/DUF883 family membrane-anchored ribosome-binding protein
MGGKRRISMEETVSKTEAKEMRDRFEALKKEVAEVVRHAKEKVDKTAEWAKEHPTATLGIATGIAASIGFAIGLLIGRRRD